MKREIAGVAFSVNMLTQILRSGRNRVKAAFLDELLPAQRDAEVVGRIGHIGSKLSEKELAIRNRRGGSTPVVDAALMARIEKGEPSVSNLNDVPLG